jgi:hypothetical protein
MYDTCHNVALATRIVQQQEGDRMLSAAHIDKIATATYALHRHPQGTTTGFYLQTGMTVDMLPAILHLKSRNRQNR